MTCSVTATFVFTDLVDSTVTATRLGPEAAEELRQTHFRLLRGAVTASGGTEVKNLGDGLMVMYSSPSRALAGATGMQQAIEHHNRSAGEPLAVRIGISVGEATEEDGDYFGDPVVEASRLCGVAGGGQILATETLRLMVGRHATQTFAEVGALELKGLPDPVPVVEVVWEPVSVAGAVPLPSRLVGAATDALFGFFGRAAELEAIADSHKLAISSDRCQAVFVAGEAGMGKTSLVAQAARVAHGEGTIVVFGHSDEDLGVAYQPWIEVLGEVIRNAEPETLAGLRSAQLGALARLVPEVGEHADRVADPDTERLLLLQGVAELLGAESRRAPMLIVLDDLHWADTATLQLLRHLVASSIPMHVTIACTYRDTDLSRGDPLSLLLADLRREVNVTRITLKGLEDETVMELLAAAAGHELDDTGIGFAHALRRETDGNPFFTAEMLRHLGESGGIVLGDDGRWSVSGELDDLGLPSSVRDVVGRRVERLGDEALRVLRIAAVIGRDFDVGLLADVADVDEDSLLDLMDAAVSAAVLVESADADRFRFAHAITQHTLYDDFGSSRRSRTHRRVADALEARVGNDPGPRAAELARHFVAATKAVDATKAVTYSKIAGDEALAKLAPSDAVSWYTQALDLYQQMPSDPALQCDLLIGLGTAQRRLGDPAYRQSLLDASSLAYANGEGPRLIRAALENNRGGASASGEVDNERVEWLLLALDEAGDDDSADRARLLATLAAELSYGDDPDRRARLSTDAMDTARRVGDAHAFVQVVAQVHHAYQVPGELEVRLADLQEAVAIADALGDPLASWRVHSTLTVACLQAADRAGFEVHRNAARRLADRLGTYERWSAALNDVLALCIDGDLAAAEAQAEVALGIGVESVPEAFAAYGVSLIWIRRAQDRLDELVDAIAEAAVENPGIPALRAALSRIYCDVERLEDARALVADDIANRFEMFGYDDTWLLAMQDLATVCTRLGEREAADFLYQRLQPFETQVGVLPLSTSGPVALTLGMLASVLGRHDVAAGHFEVATAISRRLASPYWDLNTRLESLQATSGAGAPGEVNRSELEEVVRAADGYGFAALASQGRRLVTMTEES